MDNEMLQNLFGILKDTVNGSKNDDKTNSLYSEIENILSKFQQPQQEMFEEYEEKRPDARPAKNNNFFPSNGKEEKEVCRSCGTNELLKNGGFEIANPNPEPLFKNWLQVTNKTDIEVSLAPFEGEQSARFVSQDTNELELKTAQLFQNITVTPGCRYELSFAENFFNHSLKVACKTRLSARVFYGDPTNAANQVDLINVDIYKPHSITVENRGYSFHQKAAEIPIPNNVSSVTVEFIFEVTDVGGTDWRIDGVSVRSVSTAMVCNF